MDGNTRTEEQDQVPMADSDWLADDICLTEETEITQDYVSNGKNTSDSLGFGQGATSRMHAESSDNNPIYRRAPTQQQKRILVEFLERYPALARGRVKPQLKFRAQQLWESITARLNAAGGCVKTVIQWRKCWMDLLRRVRAASQDGFDSELDSWDRRTLAFAGDNFNSDGDFDNPNLIERQPLAAKPGDNMSAASDEQPRFIKILPKPLVPTMTLVVQRAVPTPTVNSMAGQKSMQVPRLRPTKQQKYMLLEFLRKYPTMVRGRLKGEEHRKALRLWKVVAERLNTAGGCVKTRKGWQKFWSDSLRNLYKRRESASLREDRPLDVWDKGVLSLINDDFRLSNSASDDAEEMEDLPQSQEEESLDMGEDSASIEAVPATQRMSRPSYGQKLMLAEFLEQHPKLARGQLQYNKYYRAGHMWASFVDRLNASPGCKKSLSQWRKFWADRKLRLLTMYKAYKRELQTNPDKVSPFNEWEIRMLSLLMPDAKLPVANARRDQPTVVKTETVQEEPQSEEGDGKLIEVELPCVVHVSKVEQEDNSEDSEAEKDDGAVTPEPAHLETSDVRELIDELRRNRELQQEQLAMQRQQLQQLERLREAVQYQGNSISNLIQEMGKRFDA